MVWLRGAVLVVAMYPLASPAQLSLALASQAELPQIEGLGEELAELSKGGNPAYKYAACVAFSVYDAKSANLLPKLKKSFYCQDFDKDKIELGLRTLTRYSQVSTNIKWQLAGPTWYAPISQLPGELSPPAPLELSLGLMKESARNLQYSPRVPFRPIDADTARYVLHSGFSAAFQRLEYKATFAIRNTRPFDPAPPMPPGQPAPVTPNPRLQ